MLSRVVDDALTSRGRRRCTHNLAVKREASILPKRDATPSREVDVVVHVVRVTKALNWVGGPRVTGGQGPLVGDVYMLDIRVITLPRVSR